MADKQRAPGGPEAKTSAPERPKQARAIQTRGKILDGLEQLLADREFEHIAIADIAKAAGVAVGSVYSHFKDKQALLPALLQRHRDHTNARIKALEAGENTPEIGFDPANPPTLRTMLTLTVEGALQQVRSKRGSLRAIYTYRRLHPEADTPEADAMALQAFQALLAVMDIYRAEIPHDFESAIRILNYTANILFLDEALFNEPMMPAHMMPSDAERVAAYGQMLYLWLTTPPEIEE